MTGRTIAIGDIHGCSRALDRLLEAIDPGPGDTVVALGDYVDRGPDSRGVIDRMIALADRCRLLPILGNHDELLLAALHDRASYHFWLGVGGVATVDSYGGLERVPEGHLEFLRSCLDYHETDRHIFLHARYEPDLPMDRQSDAALRWESARDDPPGPHHSGKIVIAGHSAQKDGTVMDLGHFLCIDTYCYGGGWLTALDVGSGRLWQADRDGRLWEETC